jgi:hypothetical protein
MLMSSSHEVMWGTRSYLQLKLPLSVFPLYPQNAHALIEEEGWIMEEQDFGFAHRPIKGSPGSREILYVGNIYGPKTPEGDGVVELENGPKGCVWLEGVILRDTGNEPYEHVGAVNSSILHAYHRLDIWTRRYVYGNLSAGEGQLVESEPIKERDVEHLIDYDHNTLSLHSDVMPAHEKTFLRRLAALSPVAQALFNVTNQAKSVYGEVDLASREVTVTFGVKTQVKAYRLRFGRELHKLCLLCDHYNVPYSLKIAPD